MMFFCVVTKNFQQLFDQSQYYELICRHQRPLMITFILSMAIKVALKDFFF